MATGCASGSVANIPNAKFYKEVPFIDGPEGVSVETLTQKTEDLDQHAWEDIRPYLVCTDPESLFAIRKQWYEACRYAGPKCNVAVDSVFEKLKLLDDLTRAVLEGK